ncbi:hypothetical protein TRFO_16599 [Tritrichomonas foetus]|uniref:E2F/DP family winged-helix DNA-binding domain-containing protein n=1 Tax=Tritrichomonas foetus TaxID=1144522 RepID=A0A1J4KQS3_9EUKA|nr:hypothetical protein TRFO_16599 [Tritrichomonas foetus]|eukprot:OHT13280.1 hypothetical protein TRFO_16599 [Tritrichomonas foetus]
MIFFNMLTTLGVCKVIKKGQLAWISLKEVHKVLARNYEKLEMLAISSTFEDIFILEPSPSLGSIALKFIGLFLYLNVDTLSVKQVAKVFHDGKTDIKSLERRLYMVLNFLEVIDIVKHSDRVGQYKLIINRESILNPAWAMRQISQTNTIGFTIESLLSRPNLFHIRIIYENRRELFKRSYSLK